MARLRYNGLSATLAAPGLTNSATSVNFAAALTHSSGTNVPTLVSGDYIPLSILDTNGHLSEVVWLTAYTAAATSGTIARAKESTTGVVHAAGDKVVHGALVRDLTEAFLLGSPDAPPSPANAKDIEGNGTSTASLTNTPTAPTTINVNSTVPGRIYVRANALTTAFTGGYETIPGAYPFTVTAKVNSNRRANSTLGLGLFLSTASPTGASPIMWFGPDYSSGLLVQRLSYSSFATTSFVSASSAAGLAGWAGPLYLRIVATSATSIKTQASTDGLIWHTLDSALNPGFTPGVFGFAMSENGTADLEGVADFLRVT